MKESSIALDQVVVVGYGSQKKVNLTGAVAAVQVDEKNQRPFYFQRVYRLARACAWVDRDAEFQYGG